MRSPASPAGPGGCVTQMHFARQNQITPEMRHVAQVEGLEPEQVRAEIARGRMIIPANVQHPALQPTGIGIAARCKINANIGNSKVASKIDGEVEKLQTAVRFGADTVMDLSTGGNIDRIREAIIAESPVPVGTVPIYQVIAARKKVEDFSADDLFDMIEHQARQGVDSVTVHCGVLREYLPYVRGRVTGIVSRGATTSR